MSEPPVFDVPSGPIREPLVPRDYGPILTMSRGPFSRRADRSEEEASMADALSGILETTDAERLATGFVFTEGPLWHPDGFYYFVDIRRSGGELHRYVVGKGPELV